MSFIYLSHATTDWLRGFREICHVSFIELGERTHAGHVHEQLCMHTSRMACTHCKSGHPSSIRALWFQSNEVVYRWNEACSTSTADDTGVIFEIKLLTNTLHHQVHTHSQMCSTERHGLNNFQTPVNPFWHRSFNLSLGWVEGTHFLLFRTNLFLWKMTRWCEMSFSSKDVWIMLFWV